MQARSPVYLADTQVVIPPLVDSEELADVFFHSDRVGRRLNRIATRAARGFGIRHRSCVLDLARFPEIALCDERHSPACWGVRIVERLLGELDVGDVGFLSVSYNISSHRNMLPNLASQIALATGLELDLPPQELAYYGCASGLFSLQAAVDYCRHHRKAAVVFCFDQCTWSVIRNFRQDNPNLKAIIRTNLLFSDGGIGILVVPEALRDRFQGALPRIDWAVTGFQAGDALKMVNGDFHVADAVAELIPPLVTERIIGPAFRDAGIRAHDIPEWSIHQGGPAILDALCKDECLGLSDQQVGPSRALFRKHGNLSGPSSLFVLDHHFHTGASAGRTETCGAVLGFGAGYYMGMMVYHWDV
jgi:predicted naringenin-chalcone synthase